jgi:phosphatidylglycerophosphate synthase
MLDTKRHWFKDLEKLVGSTFGALPITPNQYTYLSGLAVIIFLLFIANGNLIIGTIFFAIASVLDFIDGSVARFKNMVTIKGSFLDTILIDI